MDIISLYYFSELAKDLHITRTANRLFISQQTLSNHIQRLEDHYGMPLLCRKPVLALTPAGEQVLSFAKAMTQEEANLQDILADVRGDERGILRFGGSTLRMNACLPGILPVFSARYPNVELRITDTISSRLEPQVLEGTLDFAIVLSQRDHPHVVSEPLMDDQIYLCVADALLAQYYEAHEILIIKEKALQGADLKDFERLPFCLHSNRMGQMIRACFDEAQVTPRPYLTSTYTQLSSEICFQRLAACFIPQMRLAGLKEQIPADINIFPLHYCGKPLTQSLRLIRRKDRYLPRYAQYFLETLFAWFSDVEQTHMERIIL